jgi:hypothetical protein
VKNHSVQKCGMWQQNIRNDTFANYHLSMAIAIWHSDGAECAKPWLEAARAYHSGYQAAITYAFDEIERQLAESASVDDRAKSIPNQDSCNNAVGSYMLAKFCTKIGFVPKSQVANLFQVACRVSAHHHIPDLNLAASLQLALCSAEAGDIKKAVSQIQSAAVPSEKISRDLHDDVTDVICILIRVVLEKNEYHFANMIFSKYYLYIKDISEINFIECLFKRALPVLSTYQEKENLRMSISTVLDRVSVESPSISDNLSALACTARINAEYAIAESAARQSIRANPRHYGGRVQLSLTIWSKGDRRKAFEIMAEGAEANSEDWRFQAQAAFFANAAGLFDEAERYAHNALTRNPSDPLTQAAFGAYLLSKRKEEELLSTFNNLNITFAIAQYQLSRYHDSLNTLNNITDKITVESTFFKAVKAITLEKLNMHNEARILFKSAVDSDQQCTLNWSAHVYPKIMEDIISGISDISRQIQ